MRDSLISRAKAAAKKRPKAAPKVTKKTSASSNPVVPAGPNPAKAARKKKLRSEIQASIYKDKPTF